MHGYFPYPEQNVISDICPQGKMCSPISALRAKWVLRYLPSGQNEFSDICPQGRISKFQFSTRWPIRVGHTICRWNVLQISKYNHGIIRISTEFLGICFSPPCEMDILPSGRYRALGQDIHFPRGRKLISLKTRWISYNYVSVFAFATGT